MHSSVFAHMYPSEVWKTLISTTFLTNNMGIKWILPYPNPLPSSVRTSACSWELSSSICQVEAWVQNKALSMAMASGFSALQYLTRTGETWLHSHLWSLIAFCYYQHGFTYVSWRWRCKRLVCSTLDCQLHIICIDAGLLCMARVNFCIFQYSSHVPFEKQEFSLRLD